MLDATKKQGITIGLISKQILFDQESLIGKSTAQIVCLEYSGKNNFFSEYPTIRGTNYTNV
jgi:hypothetical protein